MDVDFPNPLIYNNNEYKLLGCVGGCGDGQIGLLVQPNRWVFNTNSITANFTSVTWYLLYIKNI